MGFTSVEFMIFFLVLMVILRVADRKYQWGVTLLASFIFYFWPDRIYLLAALIIMILATYFIGRSIGRRNSETKKRLLLILGISLNLLILIGFKYYSFIVRGLLLLKHSQGMIKDSWMDTTIVSVGISFVAFQAISYLVDIRLEKYKPEKHLGYFALYLSYFPKLLQGPLERADVLIPQLKAEYVPNYDNIRSGIVRFSWGLLKKVAIANRLAVITGQVFQNVGYYHGLSLIIAVGAFAIQIYADFSGYTDMALGIARIFNISLTDNFNKPYFARNVAEFWRRWHISLMNWLLDYIFTPLQLAWRRKRTLGLIAAVFIVFMVSGLWHGVGWTYLAWGLVNGAFVIFGVALNPLKDKVKMTLRLNSVPGGWLIQKVLLFGIICFGWILFRANSMSDAIYVITHVTAGLKSQISSVHGIESALLIGLTRSEGFLTIGLLFAFTFIEILLYKVNMTFEELVLKKFFRVRWPIYLSIITAVLLFAYKGGEQFIYFKY